MVGPEGLMTPRSQKTNLKLCCNKKVCYRWLHSAPRANVKRASFLLAVGAFRPKFYVNGVIPCQNIDTVRYVYMQLIALQPCRWEFLDNKTVQQILMIFGRNLCEKRQIWVTHNLDWWLVGKPMIDFLFGLTKLFFAIILYYGSGVMRRNVYSSAIFTVESTSLHSNFTWTGSSPSNHSWHQKKVDTLQWAARW